MIGAEVLAKGGVVVWVLLGYSAIGLAIVLERLLLFARQRSLPIELWNQLSRLLESNSEQLELKKYRGPEANIIKAVMTAAADGVNDLQSVAHRIRSTELQRMEFGLRTLGILGNTAPLLGLLGTITGMIKAFMVIESAGGKVDAQALAGGIWEAMITTGVGLAVAIPLLILLHFLEGIVERRDNKMNACIALVLERKTNRIAQSRNAEGKHLWDEVTDGI